MSRYPIVLFILLLVISYVAEGQEQEDTIPELRRDSTNQYSEAELSAFYLIDSVKKAELQKKEYKRLNLLISRNISTEYFILPLKKLFDYNGHEGIRIGLGLKTNDHISKQFSLGGYIGYGFKDEAWKYGGDFILNLHKDSETKLHFSYIDDVKEKAGYSFFEPIDFTSTKNYRRYMLEEMDLVEKYEVSLSFLSLQYLKTRLFANQSHITDTDNYLYGPSVLNSSNQFVFSEIGIQFRYAYKEKYLSILNNKYTLGTNYPIFLFNVTQGTKLLDGEYEYTRYEAKVTKSFQVKNLGKSKLAVVGGLVDGNIPISKLYSGHGSYQPFSFETENSFGTMRLGEFYSDRFLSVFFKHNFGNALIRYKKFRPEFALVNNFGIGEFSKNTYHQTTEPIQSIEKGYYECGLLINNILNQSFLGYGVGVFYRYGPYSFDKTAKNFSYKLSLTIGL